MPTSGPWPPYSAAGQRLRRNLQKESSVNVLDLPDLARRPRAFPGVPPAQYRAAQGPYNQQHARACIGLHGLTVTHLVCRLLLLRVIEIQRRKQIHEYIKIAELASS